MVTNEDFSGYLLQYDTDGNLIDGLNYENGVLKNIIKPIKKDRLAQPELNCSNPIGPEVIECIMLKPVTITAPAINPWPLPADPGGPRGGSIPIGGGGSNAPGKNSITDIKIDQINDPCMLAAIKLAIANNLGNEITRTFNTLFAGDEKFNVIFKDLDLGPSTLADTRASNKYTIEITLSNTLLPNSSHELIVATILHEAIHAMYDTKAITEHAPRISFDEYIQHNLMAGRYVDKIANALREIFPQLPEYDAKALGWGGLQDGTSWKAIDKAEANKLLLKAAEYDKDHDKGKRCSK